MRVTKYNKKVTVQKMVPVENEIGGWKNAWPTLYTWWVSVKPLRGLKRFEFSRFAYTEAYELEGRKRADDELGAGETLGDCRIVYDGREFQIASIEHDDDKTYMVISR